MGACHGQPASRAPAEPRVSEGAGEGTFNSSTFILSNSGNVHKFYAVDDAVLGAGAFGSVSQGKHRSTKRVRAIKTISKAIVKNIGKFRREIAIMKDLDHPGIVKLFETFEDLVNIHLAMELCSGGELFDRIIEAGAFAEREGAVVTQQILRAVRYMHDKQVVHRDLKPENFLFLNRDPLDKSVLKIIDFGLARTFAPGQALTTKVGTPYYVAPQVLQGKYDHLCDVWSIGVIMYILLCGYPPFHGRNNEEVLTKVRKASYSFAPNDWATVSGEAKDLIRMMLKLDARNRCSAEEALGHKWIRDTAPRASTRSLRANRALVDNLRSFRSLNKLKKAALQIIAGQLDDAQLRGLRDTFTALDTNGDGMLTVEELQSGLERAGFDNVVDLRAICEGVDTDCSGVIDYTEFMAAALDQRCYLSEQACWTAFKVFDRDGDGKISVEELRSVLEDGGGGPAGAAPADGTPGARRAAEVLGEVDRNGDGKIDYQEFVAMMSDKSVSSPVGAAGNRRGGA